MRTRLAETWTEFRHDNGFRIERQHPGVTADHIGTPAGAGVTYRPRDMNAWMTTALAKFWAVAPVSAMPRGFGCAAS